MWRPKKYQITVHGHLEESLSERLAGMRITTSTEEERWPVTILEGRLIDQAELSGVYNIELTPAVHLTLDAQLSDSSLPDTDTATILGTSLQILF